MLDNPAPRIAFAGNRRIGLRALALLAEAGLHPVVLFVPASRDAQCTDEMLRIASGVLVVEGRTFRTPEVLDRLREARIDYLLSVHFPYLFPGAVLEVARIGALNLHPSYLPFNRGWHTPSWAILDGTPYGATLHWMVEEVDAGEVALQRRLDILPEDTGHSLYQRAMDLEIELLRDALPLLRAGVLPRVPQPTGGSHHSKHALEGMREISGDERASVRQVVDRLRALTTNTPCEAAVITIDGQRYRVRVEITPDETPDE